MSIGLILEGGGMRGIYTAGVLDFFMDKNISFPQVYGVSAGSCHACSYLSGQRGRAFRISTAYLRDKRYCSVYSLLTTGDLFGAKMCYDDIPNQLDPYDYEAYKQYDGSFYAVVTNCATGQAEYMQVTDMARDIIAVRASSSLPLLSKNVIINGQEYLDGGIADSIPLAESIKNGNVKNVLVLTQCATYEKQPNELLPLIRRKYRRYPNLVEAVATRHIRYNETLRHVREEQEKGNAFVIRPKATPGVRNVEKDIPKLRTLYDQGYADAVDCYEDLLSFLET